MWLADLDIIKSNMKIKEIVESIENLRACEKKSVNSGNLSFL